MLKGKQESETGRKKAGRCAGKPVLPRRTSLPSLRCSHAEIRGHPNHSQPPPGAQNSSFCPCGCRQSLRAAWNRGHCSTEITSLERSSVLSLYQTVNIYTRVGTQRAFQQIRHLLHPSPPYAAFKAFHFETAKLVKTSFLSK